VFFFEKKNQKTFDLMAYAAGEVRSKSKSFLLLFFKKEVLSLS